MNKQSFFLVSLLSILCFGAKGASRTEEYLNVGVGKEFLIRPPSSTKERNGNNWYLTGISPTSKILTKKIVQNLAKKNSESQEKKGANNSKEQPAFKFRAIKSTIPKNKKTPESAIKQGNKRKHKAKIYFVKYNEKSAKIENRHVVYVGID